MRAGNRCQSSGCAGHTVLFTSAGQLLGDLCARKLDIAIPFGFTAIMSVSVEMTPTLAALSAALRETAARIPGVKFQKEGRASPKATRKRGMTEAKDPAR